MLQPAGLCDRSMQGESVTCWGCVMELPHRQTADLKQGLQRCASGWSTAAWATPPAQCAILCPDATVPSSLMQQRVLYLFTCCCCVMGAVSLADQEGLRYCSLGQSTPAYAHPNLLLGVPPYVQNPATGVRKAGAGPASVHMRPIDHVNHL